MGNAPLLQTLHGRQGYDVYPHAVDMDVKGMASTVLA